MFRWLFLWLVLAWSGILSAEYFQADDPPGPWVESLDCHLATVQFVYVNQSTPPQRGAEDEGEVNICIEDRCLAQPLPLHWWGVEDYRSIYGVNLDDIHLERPAGQYVITEARVHQIPAPNVPFYAEQICEARHYLFLPPVVHGGNDFPAVLSGQDRDLP